MLPPQMASARYRLAHVGRCSPLIKYTKPTWALMQHVHWPSDHNDIKSINYFPLRLVPRLCHRRDNDIFGYLPGIDFALWPKSWPQGKQVIDINKTQQRIKWALCVCLRESPSEMDNNSHQSAVSQAEVIRWKTFTGIWKYYDAIGTQRLGISENNHKTQISCDAIWMFTSATPHPCPRDCFISLLYYSRMK